MKRALVTGGTGFVGANLVRRLLCDGHTVHLLVRPGYRSWRLDEIRADVQLHEVELADAERLTTLLKIIRPDWIFHLAVHGAYSDQTDVRQIVQTNILGTINLVQAALAVGFAAFINTGSSSEYGYKDHAPTETTWLDPNSYYAVTKAAATLFCRYTAQHYQVCLPTLRLYSVYGPYEEPKRLIPTLIRHGLQGQLPPLVNPDIARDYVYIEDVVDCCVKTISEESGIYNVGNGIPVRTKEIFDLICEITGKKLNLEV
ncbi:MAG: NAD-dependent epimerase/dehydratase family protein, partial [Spirulinaceae cyanobacterium RM2_2_10]|nr:NAD-dependent epimerase/dehydratase family protein [Spirulinaceae cyanobacterium RM2_2_10]